MENELEEKINFVELLKTKGELFHLIYEYNMIPAGYMHKSWIEPIIPNHLLTRLFKSKRGLKKLSKLILQHSQLKHDFFYGFYEPKYRLALLPVEILKTLTFYGGIALNYKEIKTVIDKERKEKIIEKIGKKGYRFAVVNSPLLIGNLEQKIKMKIQWDDLKRFLQDCGEAFFLTAYANDSQHVYKRVLLKFKKNLNPHNRFLESDIDPLNIFSFFIRIMKQVVDRRWQLLVL
jgi:hypothetical protein